jgi:hypothetical protein
MSTNLTSTKHAREGGNQIPKFFVNSIDSETISEDRIIIDILMLRHVGFSPNAGQKRE